jgi:hypothetical protein
MGGRDRTALRSLSGVQTSVPTCIDTQSGSGIDIRHANAHSSTKAEPGRGATLPRLNLPASDSDKAASIGPSLAVSLPEGPLEIGRFNPLAPGASEHFQRRTLSIIAAVMRPMRQPVVIADQFTVKFDRSLDRLASFPVILANPGLNSELALDQVLPGMALFI